MEEALNKDLLMLSAQIAHTNYTPENKGIVEEVKKGVMTFTPNNIKAIYDELSALFKS